MLGMLFALGCGRWGACAPSQRARDSWPALATEARSRAWDGLGWHKQEGRAGVRRLT